MKTKSIEREEAMIQLVNYQASVLCAPWDDELQKDLHIFPIVPNHKALRNPSHLQPNKNQQLHMYKLFISYIFVKHIQLLYHKTTDT